MGVEPFLVSSSIEGVLAQRLVRKVCANCAVKYRPGEQGDTEVVPRGITVPKIAQLRKGEGCRECRNTGYRGRLGVFELLTLVPELREMIMDRSNAPAIAKRAIELGELTTLSQDGQEKLLAGHTTLAEITRALAV